MDMFHRLCWLIIPLVSAAHSRDGRKLDSQEALELREGPAPSFLPTPTYYTARVGQRVVLKCAVTDLEDLQVIWRNISDSRVLSVGDEPFLGDGHVVVDHIPEKHQWNLVIQDAELTDTGLYECQVSSQLRNLRKHVHLTIKEAITTPRPDINVSGSNYVAVDDQIYLICNATGLEYPPDDLDWFFNGNKLYTNERVIIKEFVSLTARTIVSSLEIRDAQLNDSGMYVCRTSNLQISSLRVSVLKTDSNNVKRGTIPGQSDEKYDGNHPDNTDTSKPREGNDGGSGGGGKGSANYHHKDDGSNPGSGNRPAVAVDLLLLSLLSVAISLSFYTLFPS